jgi:hypothetical protein
MLHAADISDVMLQLPDHIHQLRALAWDLIGSGIFSSFVSSA